jgi:hypothetical protein
VSEGFVKLYGDRLLTSTLWLECWQARLVFVGMLAAADADGVVDMPSVRVLARQLNLSVEDTEVGLGVLEAPDSDSRTPDLEGRRVVREGNVWRIVNHRKYREVRTKAQVQAAKRVRKHRVARQGVTTVTRNAGNAAQRSVRTEAEAEAEAEAEEEKRNPSLRSGQSAGALAAQGDGLELLPHEPKPARKPRKPRDESRVTWDATLAGEAKALRIPKPEVAGKVRDAVIRMAREHAGETGKSFPSALREWVVGGLKEHLASGKAAQWAIRDWTPYAPSRAPNGKPRLAPATTHEDFADAESFDVQLARLRADQGRA